MKYLANILICCLLTATLCGCQTAKTPATDSSTPSAISKEDIASATEEETSTHISNITDDSSLNNSSSTPNYSSQTQSSSIINYTIGSGAVTNSASSDVWTRPPPLPLNDFSGNNADEQFLDWIKECRYKENLQDLSHREDPFLVWAYSQKEILLPVVDSSFALDSVNIIRNDKVSYIFKYQSKKDDIAFSLTIYPTSAENTGTQSLLKLIKEYDYASRSSNSVKYVKSKDKCKWGTYYISNYSAWFLCNDYLIKYSHGTTFNSDYFELIDLECVEFNDRFYSQGKFLDWVKTNRGDVENDAFGRVLLDELKQKNALILPSINSAKFKLKEICPFYKMIGVDLNTPWHAGGYKVVYYADSPVEGINSLEFEIYPSRGKSIPYYKSIPTGTTSAKIEEDLDNYEFIKSTITKCRNGLYILDKNSSSEAYFSHWHTDCGQYDILFRVNTNEPQKKFKEEYFDLFDIEYISLD